MQIGESIANALDTETENMECKDGKKYMWEARPAKGKLRISQKIEDAAQSHRTGDQFEAEAAKHNKMSGDLKRSEQMSGTDDDEKVKWI